MNLPFVLSETHKSKCGVRVAFNNTRPTTELSASLFANLP
ncbi:hypothetical protein SAMN02910357_00861 [Succinivibrio dextrinosolvens]|nr:hypothetical protein SAMN02910357_00861 [Succinivibrio dextrinosolvens]